MRKQAEKWYNKSMNKTRSIAQKTSEKAKEHRKKLHEQLRKNRKLMSEKCKVSCKGNKGKERAVRAITESGTTITFQSITIASKMMGINQTSITRCAKGKQKTAGGYKWEYLD